MTIKSNQIAKRIIREKVQKNRCIKNMRGSKNLRLKTYLQKQIKNKIKGQIKSTKLNEVMNKCRLTRSLIAIKTTKMPIKKFVTSNTSRRNPLGRDLMKNCHLKTSYQKGKIRIRSQELLLHKMPRIIGDKEIWRQEGRILRLKMKRKKMLSHKRKNLLLEINLLSNKTRSKFMSKKNQQREIQGS